VLLAMGVAGLAGTALIGAFIGRGLYRVLIARAAAMAAIAVALIVAGAAVATAVLLIAWGLVGTALPVAWWTWLARTCREDAEAGGGLMVAVIQLAITAGAAAAACCSTPAATRRPSSSAPSCSAHPRGSRSQRPARLIPLLIRKASSMRRFENLTEPPTADRRIAATSS
jgi:hypothetical protein